MAKAPTKEAVSNKFHTNSRLDSLRRQAIALYTSPEISTVLVKVNGLIESNRLELRADRNLHLDLQLQKEILSWFLGYNPLWLRIALEVVYGVTIPLSDNSDVVRLSNFLMCRFFKDDFLLKKYKSPTSEKYGIAIKKFVLKKFLAIIYFLDQAKTKRLIAHDPCLFCKSAPIKESRQVLINFAKELVSAIGDITKFLRYYILVFVLDHYTS